MTNEAAEVIPAPGDDLCLAFANTRYWRGTPAPTEELNSPDDLLRWVVTTQRLPPGLVRRIGRPDALFSEAISLRETIFRCFAATACGDAPVEGDLKLFNLALAKAPERGRVAEGGWDIGDPQPSTSLLLAPTLWSAADLLAGSQLARVRQCGNPDCLWVFLDNSKSGNRRWCSMSACGNRAKAHRHYLRQKEK